MSKTIKERFVEALEHGITYKAMYLMQFIKNEINEPYDYRSPLFWAKKYGNEKVVKALSDMGAVEEVDKEGMSEKLLKILWGEDADKIDEKRAIEMIKDGANLEKKNKIGDTALILASYHGHVEVVKALLDAGAKVDEKNDKGYTAIDFTSDDEIKKLLNEAMRKPKEKQNEQTFKSRRESSFGE